MKRTIALLTAILLCCTMGAVPVFAEKAPEEKIASDLTEAMKGDPEKLLVSIWYEPADTTELKQRLVDEAYAYAETLSGKGYTWQEREKLRTDYYQKEWRKAIRQMHADAAHQIADQLGIGEDSYTYSKAASLMTAQLTPEQILQAAALAQVKELSLGGGLIPKELPLDDCVDTMLGDPNGDGAVNASDAALILMHAAKNGAGEGSLLTGKPLQLADVNADSEVNASDAALVLQYAAYKGANGKIRLSLQSFLYEQDHTVMRVGIWPHSSEQEERIRLFTNTDDLTAYLTEQGARSINAMDWLWPHDEAEEICRQISEIYPESFFKEHHLAAIQVHEDSYGHLLEVLSITTGTDGTVTICLQDTCMSGEPLEEAWVVLVAVPNSVTAPEQIVLDECQRTVIPG